MPITFPLVQLRALCVAAVLALVSVPAVSGSATETGISDLSIHIEAVRLRVAKGEHEVAKAWLKQLAERYPAASVGISDGVSFGVQLAAVGLDATASTYFREVAGQHASEDALDARQRSHLAAAIYAVGRPQAAKAVLDRCRTRWPSRQFRCRPWAIAEVAAAKEDWDEAAGWLDVELVSPDGADLTTGQTAPIRVLKLRLAVAWHRGDQLEIGRWRSILIRRGVSPEYPVHAPTAVGIAAPAPKLSGLIWIVMSLSLLLLSALLFARRSAQENR